MKTISRKFATVMVAASAVTAISPALVNAEEAIEYKVPIVMRHAYENRFSMGNAAIEHIAKVIEKDGKAEIYIEMKGLSFMGLYGHLWGMNAYESDLESAKSPVAVEKTFKEKDLENKEREFPHVLKIVRNKTREDKIYINVEVDAMDAIASGGAATYDKITKGKGAQDAMLSLDYSKAEKVTKVLPNDNSNDPKNNDTTGKKPDTNNDQTDNKKPDTNKEQTDNKKPDTNKDQTDNKKPDTNKDQTDNKKPDTNKDQTDNKKPDTNKDQTDNKKPDTNKDQTDNKKPDANKKESTNKITSSSISTTASENNSSEQESNIKVVNRISGENRYDTAVSISSNNFTKADSVVLANGYKDADALVAAPLASSMSAPILLTKADTIPVETMKEISRLGAKKVYITGGENSVNPQVVDQLKKAGIDVIRISGEDKYQTAIKIAEIVRSSGNNEEAILVNGTKTADALSVSAFATKIKAPVLLTGGDMLNKDVDNSLKAWKLKKLTTVGGTKSLSKDVVDAAKAESKIRVSGENKYATSVAIAKYAYDNPKGIMIANGEKTTDALAAGAITAKTMSPVVLVNGKETSPELKKYMKVTEKISLIGGQASLSENLIKMLKK